MRKFLSILLAALLVSQGLLPALALADVQKQVKVTATTLNIRSGPGTDNPAVKSIAKGTLLDFVQQDGDWIQVRLPDGTLGWAAAKFLEIQDATSTTPSNEPKRDDKKRDVPPEPKPLPPPKAPKTVHDGGGSGFGGIFKWSCLVGSLATAGLAFSEHSAGNSSYDDYKSLWNQEQWAAADKKFKESEDHDSKATTFGIVSGGLFTLFLLQQFVFTGDKGSAAGPDLSTPPPLAYDPVTGQVRASLVLARF